ncbi:hypothetical protein NVP1101O_216 [Vibrio phage 1.101.O._10N.261.45.C6]|nr:hypothetical protein NVP1101O_216 [Vibrio phage 1.101.O._10N.261.45.C6]
MRDFRKALNNNVMMKYESFFGHGDIKTFWIELKSGLTLSIQAGEGNYSSPRTNFKHPQFQRYKEFEIGFPSKMVPEFMPYCEDEDKPTDTVYGWVPREVIQKVINQNGGIKQFVKPNLESIKNKVRKETKQ